MKILTEDAVLHCDHRTGRVRLAALQQHLVTIEGRRILVEDDPEKKAIVGCSNSVPWAGITPCTLTLQARTGYSSLLRIAGRRICLDSITGFTNGTPPGTIDYVITHPGQALVSQP